MRNKRLTFEENCTKLEKKEKREVWKLNTEMKKGISGSTLKLIAISAMLVDHIGAVLLVPYLTAPGNWTQELYDLYYVMRMIIGRIAFPIFCFLLTEGFAHTSNVWKYALRLGIFALVSEAAFDLAFEGAVPAWGYQNVFFTLFLGLAAMIIWKKLEDSSLPKVAWIPLGLAGIAVCMCLAELLQTDYGAYGVLCIVTLYLTRGNRLFQVVAGCAALWVGDYLFGMGGSEFWAPLGLLPVLFYRGRRGLKLKYVFYLFYPVHLTILYLLSLILL